MAGKVGRGSPHRAPGGCDPGRYVWVPAAPELGRRRSPDREQLLTWLREDDESRLAELWYRADAIRRDAVGDEIHVRGLIKVSNHCTRACGYCGLRADHITLQRYRMTEAEIMSSVHHIVQQGLGTVVLQAGEDPGISRDGLGQLIRRIKSETSLAITFYF